VGFEALLQSLQVPGHLFPCLSANRKRDEELADPVSFEVKVDRHP
jgi:hypothetical protein